MSSNAEQASMAPKAGRSVPVAIIVIAACSMAACWSKPIVDVSAMQPYSTVVGFDNRLLSFKRPVAAGTVFVIDRAIKRADWFSEEIDYIGHLEAGSFDRSLEIRPQVTRWNDEDPFAPSPHMLKPLDTTH